MWYLISISDGLCGLFALRNIMGMKDAGEQSSFFPLRAPVDDADGVDDVVDVVSGFNTISIRREKWFKIAGPFETTNFKLGNCVGAQCDRIGRLFESSWQQIFLLK